MNLKKKIIVYCGPVLGEVPRNLLESARRVSLKKNKAFKVYYNIYSSRCITNKWSRKFRRSRKGKFRKLRKLRRSAFLSRLIRAKSSNLLYK